MHEDYIQTTHGKIWYAVCAEDRTKCPVLVIHGGPGFMSMTDGLEFLWKDRPVYFYDQLGCGRSDRAAKSDFYSVENYIEELEEVRAALGLHDMYLMAFSWGCALACAYTLNKQPAGLKGLMLCAPLISTPAWDADQRRNIEKMPPPIRKAIETGEASGDYGEAYQSAMMAYYEKHVCLLKPWPATLQDAFSKLNADVYNTMWGPSEFTITGKLKNFDLTERLGDIRQPVLLTCGDRDEAGVKTVNDFQERMPCARMAVIPNASHLHQLERPGIFAAVIGDFLRDADTEN